MSLREDTHVSLRDQVRRALQERIADGRLRPGDRLFEQDLATGFGISRIPVREAIRMLQSEGFVEVQPRRRGVFVRGLDRRHGADVICLGCAGMAGLAEEVAEATGVPTVDGVTAVVGLAETLVRLNLSTSKAAYPFPRAENIPGWPISG